MALAVLVRLLGVLLLSTALGWIFFVIQVHEDSTDGIDGAQPARPAVRSEPSMVDWLGGDYNLRQCQCSRDWQTKKGSVVCKCEKECPPNVTPEFLTMAEGQALCSLETPMGYNCYAQCEGGEVKWFAQPCGGDKQPTCEPAILATKKAAREEKAKKEKEEKEKKEADAKAKEAAAAAAADGAPGGAAGAPANNEGALTWDPKEVYDLRGLQCELLNGEERCFMEDEQGRELCPPQITSKYLAFPENQYLCSSEMAGQYYCTVGCQEGNPDIRWGAHEISWCYDPKNKGSCPPRPRVIPKSEFKLKEWSEPAEPETPCRAAWKRGEKGQRVKDLTVGLLTHEPRSFRDTMETYEKLGFFDVVEEFLIYINKRRPEVDAVADEWKAKYPSIIKVMGDAQNYGIARGMTYLTGNATKPYFLFLERDFQLIEPATCVVEQLEAGIKMVKEGTADVVRYRHRKRAGRPNWAARMFKGHEDDVFKNGQPNLFCNHYYWIADPEKRWPDKMWICNDTPKMYCSDSYYCNWTNNPQLWSVEWWNREYVANFDKFKRNDPWYDLEVYMNWEPNSWNDRKFTVGQGEGLFKHVDRGNFGAA